MSFQFSKGVVGYFLLQVAVLTSGSWPTFSSVNGMTNEFSLFEKVGITNGISFVNTSQKLFKNFVVQWPFMRTS